MKQKPSSRRRRNSTKSILRLPDLEHAKAALLNSLNSMDAKRGYRHAIDEFVDWYGAVRRLAYEAADCGLLSADLAAGIRRVKGVKKLGIRLGNVHLLGSGNPLVRRCGKFPIGSRK
jgi:hypothetical protein